MRVMAELIPDHDFDRKVLPMLENFGQSAPETFPVSPLAHAARRPGVVLAAAAAVLVVVAGVGGAIWSNRGNQSLPEPGQVPTTPPPSFLTPTSPASSSAPPSTGTTLDIGTGTGPR